MTDLTLTDRKILVTGASSGIGRAVAIEVTKRGGTAILLGRNEEALIATATLTDKPSPYHLVDLGDADALARALVRICDEEGPFTGFVHSAGIVHTAGLTALTPRLLDKTMRINLYSFIEIVKYLTGNGRFMPGMSIVGVSSVAAQRGDIGRTAYSASKAALDAAVRCLAKELAPKQIRVNSVTPGHTRTNLLLREQQHAGQSTVLHARLERQYLGVCEPEDVAQMVAFLLSPLSRFTTGAVLTVDGGALST